MAEGALSILRDPERHGAMAAAAATDARERFALDTVVSQYEALYRSALP
jgi:hypothetical protein